MNLLSAGVDTATIALWLGHEQERTTHVYIRTDLQLKQRTLDRITRPTGHPGRYRAPDSVIAFLMVYDQRHPEAARADAAQTPTLGVPYSVLVGLHTTAPARRLNAGRSS